MCFCTSLLCERASKTTMTLKFTLVENDFTAVSMVEVGESQCECFRIAIKSRCDDAMLA